MEKLCRLCGETSNKSMYNIFNKNESGQQLIQLIKRCLPILVYRTDPLPKEICGTCYSKLNEYSSFQNNTIDVHNKFKQNLSVRLHESPVRLYIDTLEDAYQPQNIQLTNYRSPRSVRNCASQIQVETRTNYTNTLPKIIATRSLKILTPSIINEKSDTDFTISLQSEDGTIQKKRRLAGPKSKTRFQRFSPQSLLQCALQQINKNLHLGEDSSVSETTSETAMETETEYSISQSESQESELNLEPDFDISNFFTQYINLDEPAVCNYCMENFDNVVELSHHEVKHMIVDIGPRCDTREFGQKCKKFVGFYQNYAQRMGIPPVPIPKSVRVKRPPVPRQLLKEILEKPDLRPMKQKIITEEAFKINPYNERSHIQVDDENSLLVPKKNVTSVFTIENYEVVINGTKLKEMKKDDRRACYKDMMINGVKRKYCPICRHTFKDNWAMEAHYLSDVCQYTCKFCGRKFKYQKELFEDHVNQHQGENINKIFGPTRKQRFKRKIKRNNRTVLVGHMIGGPPKVKPIKLKQLLQKKSVVPQIKIEPGLTPEEHQPSSSFPRGRTEPYQAYFCRKCFKVFFNVNEYNKHIRICLGATRKNSRNSDSKSVTSETSTTPEGSSRRPMRSCVKDITASKEDSEGDTEEVAPKKVVKKGIETPETGFECTVCCSSFPSHHSRNSHMRIHKGYKQAPPKTALNKVAPKSHTITKQEPPQISNNLTANFNADIRLSNLNPAVARLVQNNPHLTIRSYSKSQVEKQQQDKIKVINIETSKPKVINYESSKMIESPQQSNQSYENSEHKIKRVYKCADCEESFENKSILYYHKMNSCIVKRHYECAFCRKKFGTYDQYNTHMFYVHPE